MTEVTDPAELSRDELEARLRHAEATIGRLVGSNSAYALEFAGRWRWLDSTYGLQRSVYGKSYPLGSDQERVDVIKENAFAAFKELSELTDEIGWKPWASDGGWVRRQHVLQEAVDVGHFLANILCAIDVTDEEWEDAYRAKQRLNAKRQAAGYDGVSGKCPGCKRSYDDGIDCYAVDRDGDGPPYCDVSGSFMREE